MSSLIIPGLRGDLIAPAGAVFCGTTGSRSLSRTTRLPPITGFTLVGWIKRQTTPDAYQQIVTFGPNDTGTNYYGIYIVPAGATLTFWNSSGNEPTGGTIVNGNWHHVALVVSGTGANQALVYLDGQLVITGSGSATPTAGQILINTAPDDVNALFMGSFAWWSIYDRPLTVTEIQLHKYRPWHPSLAKGLNTVLRLNNETQPGLAAYGKSFTRSANGFSISQGPPVYPPPAHRTFSFGTVSAAGPIDGTTTIAFTPTGTLLGSGALVGSDTITTVASATLLASGTLASTATITTVGSGTLTASGLLAGTGSIAVAVSGTLTGSGALAGTTSIAVDANLQFDTPSALDGTTAITTVGSGTLTGVGALAGTTSIAVSPSGTITGSGALAGTTSITTTGSATIQVSITGSTSITTAGSATLLASGTLAATTTITVSPTATLTGAGVLAGSTTIVFAASLITASTKLRQAPLVQYRINEASSGQSPTALLDSIASPLNLTLNYVSTTPSFASNANGRYLTFAGNIDQAVAASIALDTGNKVFDAFDGATQGTLEVVCDITIPQSVDGDISNIFGIGQEDGENDDFQFWIWEGSQQSLQCSFTTSAGYPSGYYKRVLDLSEVTSGIHTFHIVLDTPNATAADRLRLYMDGNRKTLTTGNDGTATIPQNAQVDIPTPNNSTGPTGPNHTQRVLIGNWVDYFGGNGGFKGRVYYAAIHANALTPGEIAGAVDRIGDGALFGDTTAVFTGSATAVSGVTGTTTITVTPSATLLASGALAGTTAVQVTPSGTLQGLISIVGSFTITTSASATLVGTGALSATVAITSTGAATLTGSGSLVGTTAIVTDASLLNSIASLQSSIAGIATVTNTLTASGVLASTTSCTSTASGTLTATGALAGTTTATSTATGTITGAGAIASTITGTSTCVAASSGETVIFSNIDCTSSVTATLRGSGPLVSSVTAIASVSATIAGTASLLTSILNTSTVSATPSIQNTISGTSVVTATLAGVGTVAVTISGTSTVLADIVGRSLITSSIAGTSSVLATGYRLYNVSLTLSGTGIISSNARITVSGSGSFIGTGSLSAVASGTIQFGSCEYSAIGTFIPTVRENDTGPKVTIPTSSVNLVPRSVILR